MRKSLTQKSLDSLEAIVIESFDLNGEEIYTKYKVAYLANSEKIIIINYRDDVVEIDSLEYVNLARGNRSFVTRNKNNQIIKINELFEKPTNREWVRTYELS